MIFADADLLFEALSNLVDNAIKFTPSGGHVDVTLGRDAGGVRFDIVDSGCGIGADQREAVLQRFYRAGQQGGHESYGLGLSIVAAIIHLHGFSLKFLDAEQGTHVSVFCSTVRAA
jgi:signal transduction histidine kinase